MNRRELLSDALVTPLFLGAAAPDAGVAALPTPRMVKPLPFDPAKLKGLSEKLLTSHHDNNYAGAVKNLGKVEEELARLKPDALPALVSGLRERALQFLNSMTLHEWYFGNLGGDGRQSGALLKALPSNWEAEFRATAMSLAGGSGWVTLSLHTVTGELLTAWSGNHTQAPAGTLPLLVLDMYEHAFALDYGAAAAKYVDAFFANLRWDEVEHRFERAQAAFKVLNSLK
jgi:Fe-Mn family superoxide dismutase